MTSLWYGDMETQIQATDNSRKDRHPASPDWYVVWQSCDADGAIPGRDCTNADWEIHLRSGASPTRITSNSTDEAHRDGFASESEMRGWS